MSFVEPYRALNSSHSEVSHWFDDLRHLATHADRREQFAVANDVAPHLSRIEFVAYDVLLNKKAWRDRDSRRRGVWCPAIAPLAGGGAALVAAGQGWVAFEPLDCFGVFPLKSSPRISLPDGWLGHLPEERQATGGSIALVTSLFDP